jgi:3-oxoacyl-(acyl-carrier-protein) synthase
MSSVKPASPVLVTGLGCVSAAGRGIAETKLSFKSGARRPSRVTLFESPIEAPVFEVRDLPREYLFPGRRTLGLALCAVDMALADAGLASGFGGARAAVCLGTTVASQLNDLEFYRSWRETGKADLSSVERYLDGDLAGHVARKYGARGPALNVVNACSSGTDAIGVALSWLRGGLCDIAIAGGADELNRIPLDGFQTLGIMSFSPCAPFDRGRRGLNLGEGAGVMVLETAAHAKARGLSAGPVVAGYGSGADAHHLTAPHPEGIGLRASITRALAEAGIGPERIAFVNAHGTATADNDRVEGRLLAAMFGPGVRFLSTKGFTGHTLGAAGGLEAVFTVLGLREGWIPASAGFRDPDPEAGVPPVNAVTTVAGEYALSTSLAFGGNNAALVFGREPG